ncbi:hypothetical protein F4801DRAFT_104762 [Xylaria longipes]|nr:hypothetical protein F4801DRAFT_104762 [Xylaria longipes]
MSLQWDVRAVLSAMSVWGAHLRLKLTACKSPCTASHAQIRFDALTLCYLCVQLTALSLLPLLRTRKSRSARFPLFLSQFLSLKSETVSKNNKQTQSLSDISPHKEKHYPSRLLLQIAYSSPALLGSGHFQRDRTVDPVARAISQRPSLVPCRHEPTHQ